MIGSRDHAWRLLPTRNGNAVRGRHSRTVLPSSLRLPRPARTAGDQNRSADRDNIGVISRPYYIRGSAGTVIAGGGEYGLTLRRHFFEDRVEALFVVRPSPRATDRLRLVVCGHLIKDR